MKMLCIGDSITRGSVGVSFVKMIEAKCKNAELVNAGVNGDTLNLVAGRLFKILRTNPGYDYIVLQAGYNDLLLPVLSRKGELFRFGYKQRIKKGAAPLLNAQDFEHFLINVIEEVMRYSTSKIILTTIGPINEWQDDPVNRKRLRYNESIRRVAGYYKCLLADAAAILDKEMVNTVPESYFLNSFWNTVLFDPVTCLSPNGAEKLSSKRKLKLTIDGVHPNRKGATVMGNTILNLLHQWS